MDEVLKEHFPHGGGSNFIGNNKPLVRAHLLVRGRVQGVAFRAFTQQQAVHLNLKGWVKNLPDGCVEAEVEGEQARVDIFLSTVRQGPPLAHVEQVQTTWISVKNEVEVFHIIR